MLKSYIIDYVKYTIDTSAHVNRGWVECLAPNAPDNCEITIANEVDGYPIVCIGTHAFKDEKRLIGITIPANVIAIKGSAFYRCTNLKYVHHQAKSAVTVYESAFYRCERLQEIICNQPYNLRYSYIFDECVSLKQIPAVYGMIAENCFNNTYALTDITFVKKTTILTYPFWKSAVKTIYANGDVIFRMNRTLFDKMTFVVSPNSNLLELAYEGYNVVGGNL